MKQVFFYECNIAKIMLAEYKEALLRQFNASGSGGRFINLNFDAPMAAGGTSYFGPKLSPLEMADEVSRRLAEEGDNTTFKLLVYKAEYSDDGYEALLEGFSGLDRFSAQDKIETILKYNKNLKPMTFDDLKTFREWAERVSLPQAEKKSSIPSFQG